MRTKTLPLPCSFSSSSTSLFVDSSSPSPSSSFSMTNDGSPLLLLRGVRSRRQQTIAAASLQRRRRSTPPQFASVTATTAASAAAPPSPPPSSTSTSKPKLELKPASDVLAGAVARAASQSTIHPLDTLKVRMQAADATAAAAASKAAAAAAKASSASSPLKGVASAAASVRSLYAGVAGAASGAGIYIGTYFAFYGAACNLLASATDLPAGAVAFLAGGAGAVGGSVVKVPLAVCIRSVQAGVYPSAPAAARSIVQAAGVRGLFTGYVPTLLEDVPDMAVKFAVYETLRAAHARLMLATMSKKNAKSAKDRAPLVPRPPTMGEDFAMGAVAGAAAAAATTPLDVVKTNMMCSAASRPSMRAAAKAALARGGGSPSALFAGVGPRALSNGINSAVFFAFFSVLRGALAKAKAQNEKKAKVLSRSSSSQASAAAAPVAA